MTPLPLRRMEYLLSPLAVLVGVLFLYELPPVGLPLSAAILGRMVFAGSGGLAIVTALAATLAAGTFGITKVVMVGPTLAVILLVANGARRRGRLGREGVRMSFLVLVTIAFAGYLAATAAGYALAGSSLVEAVTGEVDIVMEQLDAVIGSVTEDTSARLAYDSTRDSFRMVLLQIWPGINLLTVILGAWLSMGLLVKLAAVHGIDVSGTRTLDRIDVTWHVVWPLIGALGTLAVVGFLDVPESWPAAIAWNLLIVSAAVLWAQGLGVAETSLKRLRFGMIPRVLVYGFMLWIGAIVPVLVILGLSDLWINFRKLPRDGGDVQTALE